MTAMQTLSRLMTTEKRTTNDVHANTGNWRARRPQFMPRATDKTKATAPQEAHAEEMDQALWMGDGRMPNCRLSASGIRHYWLPAFHCAVTKSCEIQSTTLSNDQHASPSDASVHASGWYDSAEGIQETTCQKYHRPIYRDSRPMGR